MADGSAPPIKDQMGAILSLGPPAGKFPFAMPFETPVPAQNTSPFSGYEPVGDIAKPYQPFDPAGWRTPPEFRLEPETLARPAVGETVMAGAVIIAGLILTDAFGWVRAFQKNEKGLDFDYPHLSLSAEEFVRVRQQIARSYLDAKLYRAAVRSGDRTFLNRVLQHQAEGIVRQDLPGIISDLEMNLPAKDHEKVVLPGTPEPEAIKDPRKVVKQEAPGLGEKEPVFSPGKVNPFHFAGAITTNGRTKKKTNGKEVGYLNGYTEEGFKELCKRDPDALVASALDDKNPLRGETALGVIASKALSGNADAEQALKKMAEGGSPLAEPAKMLVSLLAEFTRMRVTSKTQFLRVADVLVSANFESMSETYFITFATSFAPFVEAVYRVGFPKGAEAVDLGLLHDRLMTSLKEKQQWSLAKKIAAEIDVFTASLTKRVQQASGEPDGLQQLKESISGVLDAATARYPRSRDTEVGLLMEDLWEAQTRCLNGILSVISSEEDGASNRKRDIDWTYIMQEAEELKQNNKRAIAGKVIEVPGSRRELGFRLIDWLFKPKPETKWDGDFLILTYPAGASSQPQKTLRTWPPDPSRDFVLQNYLELLGWKMEIERTAKVYKVRVTFNR